MPEHTATLPLPGLSGDAGVYVSGEDWLRVRSLGDTGGRALLVSGRYLLVNDGRVHPFASRHLPVAGATPAATDIPLGECWLQSITVNAEDGLPITAEIFVRIDLVRGRGSAGVILATLAQGALSALAGLAWPSAAPPVASAAAPTMTIMNHGGGGFGTEFFTRRPDRRPLAPPRRVFHLRHERRRARARSLHPLEFDVRHLWEIRGPRRAGGRPHVDVYGRGRGRAAGRRAEYGIRDPNSRSRALGRVCDLDLDPEPGPRRSLSYDQRGD